MPESLKPEPGAAGSTHGTQQLTVARARALGRERLATTSETPALDADLILEHVTGLNRTAQIIHADRDLSVGQASRYVNALERRRTGEPVAYIVGTKAFRTVELEVDRSVLVPRPETELLVEIALAALPAMTGRLRVIDVGTGSGAIALSLVVELSDELRAGIEILASDISQSALQLAARNRSSLGLERDVRLVESDLLDAVEGEFDLILANLPYLRDGQRHPTTVKEPDLALYSGADGLDHYRRLLPEAAERLTRQGLVVCEIDPSQGAQMLALSRAYVAGEAALLKDLSGRDRFLVAGSVDTVRTVIETWRYGA